MTMATNRPSTDRSPEFDDLQELEWVLAKSLLDANAHSTQAFEYYLMQTYRPDTSSDLDPMSESLQQAIHEHKKIIEELEQAVEAVAELEDKRA